MNPLHQRRALKARRTAQPGISTGGKVEAPPDFNAPTPDVELIVAGFRTLVLLVALFVPRLFNRSAPYSIELISLAAIAGIYNLVVVFAYLSPGPFGLRRPLIVALDILLITLWIRVSGQWELFPLYYIVVVVAAMWGRVFGGVLTASFCNFFFLLLWARAAGDPRTPMLFSTAFALNVASLWLVGCLVGYIAEAQERERVRRLEGQLLVANYQREIDIATQLQPLLMPTQWIAGGAADTPHDTASQTPDTEPGTVRAVGATASGAAASGAPSASALADVRPLPAMPDPTLQLGAAMKPARAFGGGDYFDVIPLGGGRTALCIADVSGKSVRAQARLPLLKYALRALAPLYPEPDALVKRLNETLAPDLQSELFIGLCYIVLDPRHHRLTWCNAGHIAPLLLPHRAPSSDKASSSNPSSGKGAYHPAVMALETDGPALGPFPEISYTEQSLPWRPGDHLLLFTDGLSDALSQGGNEDGEERLRHIALAMDETSWHEPHAVAQRLIDLAGEALEETISLRSHFSPLLRHNDPMFTAGDVRRDDMTVVVARHIGDGE